MITLGNRMKDYESIYDYRITPKLPIVMRIDGKNFSNMTKRLKFKKPFDSNFLNYMINATISVAENIQGCMLGYTQSDEITFIIRNDQSIESTPWFNNRIQKMVGIAASYSTIGFNKSLWRNGINYDAVFDCRVLSVPDLDEAIRNLIWRQNDCVKNSINSATYYLVGEKLGKKTTRKLLLNLNQNQRQELLFKEVGINWNDIDAKFKRGVILYKKELELETKNGKVVRNKWVSESAPIFTSEDGRIFLDSIIKV